MRHQTNPPSLLHFFGDTARKCHLVPSNQAAHQESAPLSWMFLLFAIFFLVTENP
jgi:hypothetical protein